MTEFRLMFRKEGKAVYISHLDLLRTVQRIFARAGLRVKHTEGFNPRPHMVFALPLSVGASSDCELVDFKLLDDIAPDEVLSALSGKCPEGIVPLKVWHPGKKFSTIKWLRADAELIYGFDVSEDMLTQVNKLFASEEVNIEKKTKHGMGTVNIMTRIKELSFSAESNRIIMHCVVDAQDPGLNPALIIRALYENIEELKPNIQRIHRVAVYTEDMQDFCVMEA